MSLIHRIRLWFAGALLLAFLGSLAIGIEAARDLLRDEAARQNLQDARALARSLEAFALSGDAQAGAGLLLALFDSGAYRRIRLIDADGVVRFERLAAPVARAPDRFTRWAALDAAAGIAPLPNGRGAHATVEVARAAGPLVDALWRTSGRLAGALALLAACGAVLGLVATGRMGRHLYRTIERAESLQRGEYLPAVESAGESGVPEMRRLTRAMNATATRLKQVFEAHSAQVELMRTEANRDPLTGLSNRANFLEQLDLAARRPRDPSRRSGDPEAGGLVLLRLLDLGAVNRSLGHLATDRIIRAIAQTLQTYARRVDGCLIGRLNGSDFALSLPAPDVAHETAEAVLELLRAALPAFGHGVSVVAGVVEMAGAVGASRLMSVADAALQRAEGRGPFAVETVHLGPAAETSTWS